MSMTPYSPFGLVPDGEQGDASRGQLLPIRVRDEGAVSRWRTSASSLLLFRQGNSHGAHEQFHVFPRFPLHAGIP
jgi:hypothetical protein